MKIGLEDILSQLPGVVCWQDMNSTFSGCNDAAFKLFGFKSAEQMIGSTYFDFRCKAVESADRFLAYDKQIIKTQSALTLMIIDTFIHGETEAHLIIRKPIIQQQKMIGFIGHSLPISTNSLLKMSAKLATLDMQYHQNNVLQRSYVFKDRYGDIGISKRESECLFYLLRGKSIPEIANILHLSKRTVESYMEHIKIKMNCYSQAELCEKSVALGFVDVIPCSLSYAHIML